MNFSPKEKKIVSAEKLFRQAGFENILKCVHCGLCLDFCPTYRELRDEKDSPRGRLYIMRGLWSGELSLEKSITEPLNRCLDCRACESACPSAVPFGELLEKTRGIVLENTPQSLKARLLRKIFLKGILCSTKMLKISSRLIKIYVACGFPKLFTNPFFRKILPKSFIFKNFLIPNCSGDSFKLKHANEILHPLVQKGEKVERSSIRKKILRIGMFSGCILDVSETVIHESTLTLLRYLGFEVLIPVSQSCCGALHVHSGDRKTSRKCALKNLAAFESQNLEAIITNAAGCGAQLKEYHTLFSDGIDQIPKDLLIFEKKIVDIMEFISRYPELLKNLNWREDEETVLYDSPCHLMHAQKVDNNSRKLLNSLPGVRLIPIEESDWCCGSAGIYNLTQPKLSDAILNRKIKSIIDTMKNYSNAKTIVTGNPGCIYQIRAGIKSKNIDLSVIHPVVYLRSRLK